MSGTTPAASAASPRTTARPRHEVIQKTVLGLKNVEHRGGICGDAGDGAGLICQIPQAFFKEEAKKLRLDQARYLKPEDRLAVGVVFIARGRRSAAAIRRRP